MAKDASRIYWHKSRVLKIQIVMSNLASHADILLVRHEILPKERRLKRVVKNVDQSQHTSRSR